MVLGAQLINSGYLPQFGSCYHYCIQYSPLLCAEVESEGAEYSSPPAPTLEHEHGQCPHRWSKEVITGSSFHPTNTHDLHHSKQYKQLEAHEHPD